MAGTGDDLQTLHADFGKDTFDINETAEIKITTTPGDAEIESLELSENSVAKLEYKDGKAILHFTSTGDATLFLTANETIQSNSKHITVIDNEVEEKKKAEEEAKRKAEEERIAAEKAEQERIAAEQAEQERLAAEQAAQEQATIAQQNAEDPIVYITNTGSKYHNASCRTLKSKIEKHLSEVRGVYEPCGICHPPK